MVESNDPEAKTVDSELKATALILELCPEKRLMMVEVGTSQYIAL